MPETATDITARLEAMTKPGYRGNLLAKGLARSLIWRDGRLPADAPNFSPDLTTNLLDHGFVILSNALRLRELQGDAAFVARALQVAAEAIESAARHDIPTTVDRGFHLVMAAAAFHIGGFAARAYSLFQGELATFNLASYEQALVHLMRRDLDGLRAISSHWVSNTDNQDAGVTARLESDEEFTVDDVLATALTGEFHRAIGTFEVGLLTGRQQYFTAAIEQLRAGETAAAEVNHVPLWWTFKVAQHLFADLWDHSLRNLLPTNAGPKLWSVLRERFIQMVAARSIAEIDLWPSQVGAAKRVVDTTDSLVASLPTSAGKTRIAELCILRTLADEKRVVYVTPLRALSAQIEFGLARVFRPLGYSVTSVYGASGVAHADLDTLQSANIVVATPEKVDFAIRQEPSVIDDVGLIVLDEGHMIGLGERELHYEMLVQRILRRNDAANRRLVCLSAVFSEGDAFDDFTNWLRSDRTGGPVRSTWRPTRQRPGRLLWTGHAGRLELDVEQEKPWVPRFVESQAPQGRREKPFPKDEQEFIVAATASFLGRGQNVLIYCPKKMSVEATGTAFLTAHRQGYFESVLPAAHRARIDDAVRIGKEWLGDSHPAVLCLTLGIGVHHGSLPRQFLGEVEMLLRERILPVCVCSPTLAQGLDLSFSVLLFRSLYRHRDEPIPAKEFANVVGRVGRAFVDLDGLYVLPIFEKDFVYKRTRQFNQLISDAQRRQLESGVKMLVGLIIQALQSRLGGDPHKLKEYVLNMNSTWEVAPQEGDKWHELMKPAMNELDVAILGVVDVLELPTHDLANYLDSCLQSSYWQRRLQRESPQIRELHEHVIRGRAQWLWKRTTAERRKAFFAAGLGYAAGNTIDTQLDEIGRLLTAAETALLNGNLETTITNTTSLAEILYRIGPFQPKDSVDNWRALVGHWLQGTALAECTDNDGVSFIQENIVYRLVWAVEAARLHLLHIPQSGIEVDPPGSILALCLTYGVPSLASALFMQAGLSSRTMASQVVQKVGSPLTDMEALRNWIATLRQKQIPLIEWNTVEERAEWKRFLRRFDHHDIKKWRDIEATIPVKWSGAPPKPNTRVRISRISDSAAANVTSVSFAPLGVSTIPEGIKANCFTGLVTKDRQFIEVAFFGR